MTPDELAWKVKQVAESLEKWADGLAPTKRVKDRRMRDHRNLVRRVVTSNTRLLKQFVAMYETRRIGQLTPE